MAGRKAIPTPIKLATGNPGRARVPKGEPTASPSRLKPPAWMKADKAALAEFKRFGKLLRDVGVMSELDETALAMYSQAYSQWVTSLTALQTEGTVLERRRGKDKYINPHFRIANEAQALMLRMMVEFGMTPSSRSRLRSVQPSADGGKGTLERILVNVSPHDPDFVATIAAWTPPGIDADDPSSNHDAIGG